MSEKRRDKRGRILRNGEIQMENGRYRFKYTDSLGQKKYIVKPQIISGDFRRLFQTETPVTVCGQ